MTASKLVELFNKLKDLLESDEYTPQDKYFAVVNIVADQVLVAKDGDKFFDYFIDRVETIIRIKSGAFENEEISE